MKHNYLEPRADIRFLMSQDIIATSAVMDPEQDPKDDVVNDNF